MSGGPHSVCLADLRDCGKVYDGVPCPVQAIDAALLGLAVGTGHSFAGTKAAAIRLRRESDWKDGRALVAALRNMRRTNPSR